MKTTIINLIINNSTIDKMTCFKKYKDKAVTLIMIFRALFAQKTSEGKITYGLVHAVRYPCISNASRIGFITLTKMTRRKIICFTIGNALSVTFNIMILCQNIIAIVENT